MITMIDRALYYKEKFNEFNETSPSEVNPYDVYKNAEIYCGWRELCVWFTGLFDILNSTKNRLDTTTYLGNLNFLKDFLMWFESWKIECMNRRASKLPEGATAYQKMSGFFTAEASDDCISMVKSIIQMTEYYCSNYNDLGHSVYFLPRRISQDLVENGFSKIRLAIGHGRLDHRTTAAACTKVNLIKEVNTSERNRKKRNSGGCLVDPTLINKNIPILLNKKESTVQCTEYAILRMNEARKRKNIHFNKIDLLIWKETNGILHL